MHDFQCDRPIKALIMGNIYSRHPASGKACLNPVSIIYQ